MLNLILSSKEFWKFNHRCFKNSHNFSAVFISSRKPQAKEEYHAKDLKIENVVQSAGKNIRDLKHRLHRGRIKAGFKIPKDEINRKKIKLEIKQLFELVETKSHGETLDFNKAQQILINLSENTPLNAWSNHTNGRPKNKALDDEVAQAVEASLEVVLRNAERLSKEGVFRVLGAVAKIGYLVDGKQVQKERLVQVLVDRLCNFQDQSFKPLAPKSLSYIAFLLSSLFTQGYPKKILSRLMDQIPSLVLPQVHWLKDKDIGMLISALIKYGEPVPVDLLEALLERLIQIGPSFSVQSLSNILRAYKQAGGRPNPAVMTLVGDYLAAQIPVVPSGEPVPEGLRKYSLEDSSLTYIIHSFSLMDCTHIKLVRQFEKRITYLEDSEENSICLCQFLHSICKMDLLSDDFFEFAFSRLSQNLDKLPPSQLSTLCWVSAKQGIEDKRFYESLAYFSLKKIDYQRAYLLSTIAGAIKFTKANAPEFMKTAGQAIVPQVSKLTPEQMANVLFSFSGKCSQNVSPWCPELVQKVEQEIYERSLQFQPRFLARLALGFAHMEWRPDKLFAKLSHQVQEEIGSYNGRALTEVAYSWGYLGIKDPEMFKAISDKAKLLNLVQWGNTQLSNFAWSMSIHGDLEPDLLLYLWKAKSHSGSSREDCQWYQAFLNARMQYPDYVPIQVEHQEEIEKCQLAFIEDTKKFSNSSNFHRNVFSILRGLGYACENEFLTSLGYSIDIRLGREHESKVAVEVDGPSHFSTNTQEFLGPAIMKHRHLRQDGWKVISVPSHEWQELSGALNRRKYLEAKIRSLRIKDNDECWSDLERNVKLN